MTAAAQAPEVSGGRTTTRDDLVEEVRRVRSMTNLAALPRLADAVRRRLGLAPLRPGGMALALLTGTGIRLAVALLATAVAGQWAAVPWGRWAVVLAVIAVFDAGEVAKTAEPVASRSRQAVEEWTALVSTVERESDLEDLVGHARSWNRLGRAAVTGVAVMGVMLVGAALAPPTGLAGLHAGSTVLLAFLLYDFGTMCVHEGNLANWSFMAREARYDHQLFWPSPADAPEVHKTLHTMSVQVSVAGMWITVFLVLTVVLVSWGSPLVLPLAVGFVVIGYLSTIGTAVSGRASVRRIVDRSRERRLAVLRDRIEAFEPHFGELSHQEAERLRDLLALHTTIRNAPTTPTTARTVLRTAAGLILPTIMFAITVFGEVSAERLLDSLLP